MFADPLTYLAFTYPHTRLLTYPLMYLPTSLVTYIIWRVYFFSLSAYSCPCSGPALGGSPWTSYQYGRFTSLSCAIVRFSRDKAARPS